MYKRLYLILCIFAYYIIYNSNAHFVFMIWIFVHDARICPVSHFKAFWELLASGSIITLDAQKNAVHAICIFYRLQYSMVLLCFFNLPFAFGVIVLQMQQKTGRSMRILDRIMYIDILFRYNNSCVCNILPPLAFDVLRLSSLQAITYYFSRFITSWTVGIQLWNIIYYNRLVDCMTACHSMIV